MSAEAERDNPPDAPAPADAETQGRMKRAHARLTAPMSVEINGRRYAAADWSLGGFRIEGVKALNLAGEKTSVRISLQIEQFDFSFDVMAEMVRLDPVKRVAAFRFLDLSEDASRALGYLSSAFLAGALRDVDGVLRRVSEPTAAPGAEAAAAAAPDQRRVFRRRATFFAVALLALISMRAALLAVTAVRPVAAWVDSDNVALSAPMTAQVGAVFAAEGAALSPGDPIAVLVNRELDAAIAGAEAEKRVLAAERRALEAARAKRNAVLAAEIAAAEKALARAQNRRRDAARSLAAAEKAAQAVAGLPAPEAVSFEERARAEQTVAEIGERLALAEAAIDDAASRIDAAQSGYFFGDARSTGFDPATLDIDIETLDEKIAAADTAIAGLIAQRKDLTLRSPCRCRLTALVRRPGEIAAPRDIVAQLRPLTESAAALAFLHHRDAARIEIGQRATVRLADGRIDREATIIRLRSTVSPDSEAKLFARDLDPERYAEAEIALSPDFADAPPAAADAKIAWPLLRWLEGVFYFSV